MKILEERKTVGPDRVSGYILKECRQEMAEPIYDINASSQETVKISKVDIMPIYKKGINKYTQLLLLKLAVPSPSLIPLLNIIRKVGLLLMLLIYLYYIEITTNSHQNRIAMYQIYYKENT